MAVCKRGFELAHPNAAGIDVDSASHFVAVSADSVEALCGSSRAPPRILKRWPIGLPLAAWTR